MMRHAPSGTLRNTMEQISRMRPPALVPLFLSLSKDGSHAISPGQKTPYPPITGRVR